jgi:hypothetical protein
MFCVQRLREYGDLSFDEQREFKGVVRLTEQADNED